MKAMILALTLATLAVAAPASAEPSVPATSPATLPLAVQFDLPSKITGRTYRIYVSRPVTPPPRDGYPVLYVMDGDIAFATASSQVILGSLTGKGASVVVGVAYPNFLATSTLRGRDLTPSQPNAEARETGGKGNAKPDDYGGADDFHRFMMEELRPLIAQMNKVDAGNQSLMGYSLGGLFTLHVMFHHPAAYRSYVAGSPSIWWNDREVLGGEKAFAEAVRSRKVAPRLLITSGRWEQDVNSPETPKEGAARDGALATITTARMVDNAKELAARLKALKGGPGYEVVYTLFPEETHNSGIPASTSRGVAFVGKR
jgi:uncharacterized protein